MKTDGKWEWIDLPEEKFIGIIPIMSTYQILFGESKANDGDDVAHCFGPDRFGNAALIAAAPELATAIDAILRNGLTKETRSKAAQALKKARTKILPNPPPRT